MTAKMKMQSPPTGHEADWDKVRVAIMRWCLRVNSPRTGRSSAPPASYRRPPIVEESRKDDFWGAKASDDETLVGKNVLGRLLMELREELRGLKAERLRRVEPPAVPQFFSTASRSAS